MEGYQEQLDKAVEIVQSSKGEARVEVPRHHLSEAGA
jgi:hypothetical protein